MNRENRVFIDLGRPGRAGGGRPADPLFEALGTLSEESRASLPDLGATMLAGSPAHFGKLIAEETGRWGRVIRAANIKPE